MSRSEGFDEFYQATYSRLVGQLYPVTGSPGPVRHTPGVAGWSVGRSLEQQLRDRHPSPGPAHDGRRVVQHRLMLDTAGSTGVRKELGEPF
jgi:hypothetical protein